MTDATAISPASRHLEWAGCFNVRDLGGLRTADGRLTRRRSIIRSDSLDRLTPAGQAALRAYGGRTVVDLRRTDEIPAAGAERGPGVDTVTVPLEDFTTDAGFWRQWRDTGLWATPLYFAAFLERFPDRVAAAVAAVAGAPAGAVVVHCGAGRDRTQVVTLVLLALAGVLPQEMITDHELSTERLRPLFAALGRPDEAPSIERLLAARGTTAAEVIRSTLDGLDAAAYLRGAGLGQAEIAAVRERLLPAAA